MKSFVVILMLSQCFFCSLFASKALVVTIDQEALAIPDNQVPIIAGMMKQMNPTALGDLGSMIQNFQQESRCGRFFNIKAIGDRRLGPSSR